MFNFRKSFSIILFILFTFSASAEEFDKQAEIKGVQLKSGKKGSNRTYLAHVSKTLPFPIKNVFAGISNYTEKCNNNYKDKRKFTDKSVSCRYNNDNIVETFYVKDFKTDGWTKEPGETERFLLGRQIYNRGSFGFYELMIVSEKLNEQKQKVITISQKMLEDNEVKVYIEPKFKKESGFNKSLVIFTLTEVKPSETALTYDYVSETDHWILNKEISVSKVFESIGKTVSDLIGTIETEAEILTKQPAPQK
jgi:hypothetical protein